jgi:flagellar biosynthesis protein FlhB
VSGAESGQEDRTEAATPRRLQRARDEGQVPVSTELASLAGLAGASLALLVFAPAAASDLARHLVAFISQPHALDLSQGIAGPLCTAGFAGLRATATVAFGALLAGTVAVLLQTGLLLSLPPLRPNLSRLSPGAGLKRLLGSNGLV